MTIDGVGFEFQLAPGTEAPAEMNIYFLEQREALCMAENCAAHAAQHLHAARRPVRDPLAWSQVPRRGDRRSSATDADVLFASHHWPRWGSERVVELPRASSATSTASSTTRPCGWLTTASPCPRSPSDRAARRAWPTSWAMPRLLRHGQPQRQGDLPALPRLVRRQPGAPPRAPAGRGRASATSSSWAAPTRCWRRRAASFDAGDYRWVAEVVNHVVFAEPENQDGPRAAGRRPRAARLPGRVGTVAQLLPDRRPGAPRRRRRSCPRRNTASPDTVRAMTHRACSSTTSACA